MALFFRNFRSSHSHRFSSQMNLLWVHSDGSANRPTRRWKARVSNNVISIVCLWIELCIYNDVRTGARGGVRGARDIPTPCMSVTVAFAIWGMCAITFHGIIQFWFWLLQGEDAEVCRQQLTGPKGGFVALFLVWGTMDYAVESG